MKRYRVVIFLVLLPLMLVAAPVSPTQVTISLTTKVPEVLVHGFLKTSGDDTPIIVSYTDVDNAFNTTGASFTYAIKTNVAIPLKVTATVTPFEQQDVTTPALVGIRRILVGNGGIESEASVIDSASGTYELLDFTPNVSGMATYSYVLTVLADQDQVQNAPAGIYESTVSIGITPNN